MGIDATAAYLQRFRELNRRSRADVARAAATSEQTIFRIEVDGQEPKATTLVALIKAIGADIQDVYVLLDDDTATRADGEQTAEARYQALSHQRDIDSPPAQPSPTDVADRVANLEGRVRALEALVQRLMYERNEGASDTAS